VSRARLNCGADILIDFPAQRKHKKQQQLNKIASGFAFFYGAFQVFVSLAAAKL